MFIQPSFKLMFSTCLVAAMGTAVLHGQDATATSSSTPVAYVFVSSAPAQGHPNVVHVYGISESGQIEHVTGSPFPANDNVLAVAGGKLYGINQSRTDIDGYAIAADSALHAVGSTDYASYNPSGCGAAGWIFADRTGADLYAMNFDGDCSNNTMQSFRVQASGELTYLGSAEGGAGSFSGVYLPLTFVGDNKFGYEAVNDNCMYYTTWAFQRTTNGDLVSINTSATMPPPPAGYNIYIPMFSAAAPSNYVAVAMEAAVPPGCSQGVPIQIGSFTADTQGNLSSTNTSTEMPDTAITSVEDMKISPAGNLLAVGGTGGLQVFHFNGAHPPTHFTDVLTKDSVSQMFWDNANHLYALSPSTGKLRIYTITASSVTEAKGSPYAIANPLNIAVQSR
ncbi:MAG TPA: hypothetical protein VKB38_01755 [Terracidiphilus sp.]|nr:hypothetical protein [Terracidiphilus sp.]